MSRSKYTTSPDETADKATDKPADGVEGTWAEKNSSGSTESKSSDEQSKSNPEDAAKQAHNQSGAASAYATNTSTTPEKQAQERLKLEKSEPPPTLKPADRRVEQAIRNMTPLGAEHSIEPSGKDEQGKLQFANKGDRVAHTLERTRQLLLERNAHLGQGQLMADIEAALAEYRGDKEATGTEAGFSPSSTGTEAGSSQTQPSTQSEGRDLAVP